MKKLTLMTLGLIFAATIVEAKYTFPKDANVKSRSEEIAAYQMKKLDKDGDGSLSQEEFEKRFETLSREDRRNIRKAKENGTYMTPEEQFKAMDTNKDGKVDEQERAVFVRKMRDSGINLY